MVPIPSAYQIEDALLIDLSLLQLSAIIRVNHFPLCEDIQPGQTGFAMAVAGAACTAERELDLGPGCAGVHIENARRDVACRALHAVVVLRIDRARETKGRIVVNRDSFFE